MKASILSYVLVVLATFSAHGATLQGLVVDYKNDPVAAAKVWVSHDRQVYMTSTDADGKFSISDLAPGKVEVVAMRDGHSLGGKEGQLLGDDFVTISLDKAKDLSLRIIDGRYEPIEGARLKSLFINEAFTVNVEDLVAHGFPSIRSDEKGIMLIPNMPRFGYTSIAVSHAAYAESALPPFPIGSEVDLIMNPGIKIRGRIFNSEGKGVPRARVSVFKISQGQQLRFSEVLSDAEGFYTMNVPPAEYYIVARHHDYAIADPLMRRIRAGSDDVIAEITLPDAHFIEGRMVMEGTGDAVAMTTIAYRDASGVVFAETMSDRDGRFTLTVASGVGSLEVTPPKRMMTVAHHTIPLDIGNKKTISINDILLKPLPAVTGIVFDNKGEPVPNAQVRTLNTRPSILTWTNEHGEYYIQIEKSTDEAFLHLYAEHPIRFQRTDVRVDLNTLEGHDLKLRSFRPKLQFMPELARNNLSMMLNEPAPEWSCEEWFNLPADQEFLSLASLKGKTVVLTFWAGFDLTGNSEAQLDELKYLYSIFKDNPKIQFVAIHDASLKPYEIDLVVRKWEIPFPVGCDVESFESFSTYNVNQIPQTVIIDPAGILKYYEVQGRLHTLIKAMLRSR
ncbi:MAG: carboxypeptidase regulatory-like domain-containing protein [Candidatus Hydrogenedentota bacterium]